MFGRAAFRARRKVELSWKRSVPIFGLSLPSVCCRTCSLEVLERLKCVICAWLFARAVFLPGELCLQLYLPSSTAGSERATVSESAAPGAVLAYVPPSFFFKKELFLQKKKKGT